MSDQDLNADFGVPAKMHTNLMEWDASPSPTVWRKRLELSGPKEAGRVTSVVRYDPNSKFAEHPHPDGEEILVLDGVFSDEHGDYPAGSYLLNPEGFSHAPFSDEGCVLFVKLRQYPGDRPQIKIPTHTEDWEEIAPGVRQLALFSRDGFSDEMALVTLSDEGTVAVSGGVEVYVIDGELKTSSETFYTGDWARWPVDQPVTLSGNPNVKLYLKTGHLPVLSTDTE